jgi:5-formyltetrahydrofolate cyclo-ligase
MPAYNQLSKKSIRALIRAKRQALSTSLQQLAAENCANTIISSHILENKNNIAFYLAQDNELSLSNLINYCFNNNINQKFYLPAINKDNKEKILQFIAYNKNSTLQNNKYHIPEPIPIAPDGSHYINPESLDLVFVPLVAFTKSGYRLGMGGGYYDRTFAFLANSSNNILEKPLLIGIGYDFQCVDYLPHQDWDIKLYGIATESAFYKF